MYLSFDTPSFIIYCFDTFHHFSFPCSDILPSSSFLIANYSPVFLLYLVLPHAPFFGKILINRRVPPHHILNVPPKSGLSLPVFWSPFRYLFQHPLQLYDRSSVVLKVLFHILTLPSQVLMTPSIYWKTPSTVGYRVTLAFWRFHL